MFGKPLSEEHKRKISEALKKNGSSAEVVSIRDKAEKDIDSINDQIYKSKKKLDGDIENLKKGIEDIKSKAKNIPKGKKGQAARDAIKAQIKDMREHIKGIRGTKKILTEMRRRKLQKVKELYRQSLS